MALHPSQALAESLRGSWQGVPERRGIQFERLSFLENGSLVAYLSTFCSHGFCLSVIAEGSYVITATGTLILTVENIAQEFTLALEDGRLTLREPTGGHPKTYLRIEHGESN